MSRPPPKDEATRAKLLHAATSVFAEVGYDSATIRQICARAEVNVAAVNYHFGDKLGLYAEVLKHATGPDYQLKVRSAVRATPQPEKALRVFVRGMFDKVYGDKPEANLRIMTREIVNPTPAFDTVVEETIRPTYKQLCEIIGQIIGHPAPAEITRLCVYSFMGQVIHYFYGRELIARLSPTLDIAKERYRIADHIVDFTLAGLRATTKPAASRKRK